MSFEESLTASLSALVNEATKPDACVTDGEVKIAATRMARSGYDFGRTPNALKALRAYLNGRSLFLAGTAGAGKTMFFSALQSSGVSRHRICIYPLSEHGNDFCSAIVDDIKAHEADEIVVDDVGCESTWNGHRVDDVLSRIIAVREASPLRTHFTSNLSGSQLRERYDERVVSRLRLCVSVPMVGVDNRRAVENAAEAVFRAKCADPNNWILCAERCPRFVGGKCLNGQSIPPILRDGSPESICGVGDTIPYSEAHIKAEEAFLAYRERLKREHGLI